jgi:hypothetical protein
MYVNPFAYDDGGTVYIYYQFEGHSVHFMAPTGPDGVWSEGYGPSDTTISESPCVVANENGTFLFHHGSNTNGQLRMIKQNPEADSGWDPNQLVENMSLSYSPSAVAF